MPVLLPFDETRQHRFLPFITLILAILGRAELLNGRQGQNNLARVLACSDPKTVADILLILQEVGFLNNERAQEKINALLQRERLEQSRDIFVSMYTNRFLMGEPGEVNFMTFMEHANNPDFIRVMTLLKDNELLSAEQGPQHFSAIIDSLANLEFVKIIEILHRNHLLIGEEGQEHLLQVLHYEYLPILLRILMVLERARFLDGAFGAVHLFRVFTEEPRLYSFSSAVLLLEQTELYHGEQGADNIQGLWAHEHLERVVNVLSMLVEYRHLDGIEGQVNFTAILTCPHLDKLDAALTLITKGPCLLLKNRHGQEIFSEIIAAEDPMMRAQAVILRSAPPGLPFFSAARHIPQKTEGAFEQPHQYAWAEFEL